MGDPVVEISSYSSTVDSVIAGRVTLDVEHTRQVLFLLLRKITLLSTSDVLDIKESSIRLLLHLCQKQERLVTSQSVLQLLLQFLQSVFHEYKSCSEQDVQRIIRAIPVLIASNGSKDVDLAGGGVVDVDDVDDDDDVLREGVAADGRRYVPPHLRTPTHASASASSSSSCTDVLPESGDLSNRQERTCYLALQLLEVLATLEPRYLQPYYTLLFSSSTESKGTSNLMSLVRSSSRDKGYKTRVLAAKLVSKILEGPAQRTYLAMAEVQQKEKAQQRGFTTLSMSLGQILVNLHADLQSAIAKERDFAVLGLELRALSVVIQASPYHRLRPNLALEVFQFLFQNFFNEILMRALDVSLQNSGNPDADDFSIVANVVNCFSLLISKGEVSSALKFELEVHLKSECGNASESIRAFLAMTIRFIAALVAVSCNRAYPSGLRLDVSVCLHRFGKVLPRLVVPFGGTVLDTIQVFLSEFATGDIDAVKPSLDEKVCQQMIRTLAETLQHAGDDLGERYVVADLEKNPEETFSQVTGSELQFREKLIFFCEDVVADAMACKSPVIRSSILQSIIHLKSDVAEAMELDKVCLLVKKVGDYACEETNSIAIRSAACKALGALLSLKPVCSLASVLDQGLSNLTSLGKSKSGTLQISLAWSLANVCDVLRAQTQNGKELLAGPVVECILGNLPSIANLSMDMATCNDKVRCNAVRCLGYVFELSAALGADWEGFTAKAIDRILDSLEHGNTKVQWNCCYAAGSFFKLPEKAEKEYLDLLDKVLRSICRLLHAGTNFKVLSHAITCISQLKDRAKFGSNFFDVLESTVFILQRRVHMCTLSSPSPSKPMASHLLGKEGGEDLHEQQRGLRLACLSLLLACLGLIKESDEEEMKFLDSNLEWLRGLIEELEKSEHEAMANGFSVALSALSLGLKRRMTK